MPPKTKRTRLSEHLADSSSQTSQGSISKQKPQEVFHFVSVNPTSEVQKSHNRTVIRSHASKYIWRQHRAGRAERIGAKRHHLRESAANHSPLSIPSPRASSNASSWSPSVDSDSVNQDGQGSPESFSSRDHESASSAKPKETNGTNVSTSRSLSVPEIDTGPLSPVLYRPNSAQPYQSPINKAPGPGEGGTFNQLTAWLADPFHTYPSMLGESTMSKLMRYACFDLWPGLVLGAANQKWDREDAAENWLPRAMQSPPLFTAFLYGAAGHMQTRKRLDCAHFVPQTTEEKLEQIICETETIKRLNKMMHDPSQACTDEVILAVLCMAFNRIDYSNWDVSDPWPKAPLRNLQWLDVYGGLSLNDQHVKGLLALIQTRGGLSAVKMPGLAETLSTSVVMLSTKYLQKPRLPFAPIFKETAQGHTPRWPTSTLTDDNDPTSNPRPDPILSANLPPDLITVLQNMHNYNNIINLYAQGLLPELELAVIADRRNWIQYNLVSLASACEFPEQFFHAHRTYESCRLAALIYSMLVIFPLPAANRPFKRLAGMMRTALVESTSMSAGLDGVDPGMGAGGGVVDCWRDARDMLLWCLVLGGMAAKGTADRDWFVRRLGEVLTMSAGSSAGSVNGNANANGNGMATRKGTWAELKAALSGVVWMDSVCDMGGHAVWMEAVTGTTNGYGL